MTLLNVQNLTVKRGECPVVDRASFNISSGECVGLIGPNGAGKTSLLRGAMGLLPFEGTSTLADLSPRHRAAQAAWLPQTREIAWPMSVERIVALGRLPYLARGARLSPADQSAVDAALTRMGLQNFRTRLATALSGGEQARVLIARTLAQDTPLLMADEPIAGLDPAAQIATLQVFETLAQEGRAALTSLHDLTLAARYCTRLIMMRAGSIIADGPPRDVLTPDSLADVFRLKADVIDTPLGLVVQPWGVIA
ncbi:ABC transporter ATP-binding protein [Marivita geojedonensis]|uniref:ABC transporter n=1 Tax=Marivita geojedonensis TaxID=1123756 RepID=A0A1X4NAR4_9RHOB|nr:ABC transporter ATP-binding protein [Marivita geojedonensis]OSQ43593.1 ABC transporter [Marivita geojedonensis]PRY73798.1 iron complex transport system ATP-binding protein [Marivita geojedonensis]